MFGKLNHPVAVTDLLPKKLAARMGLTSSEVLREPPPCEIPQLDPAKTRAPLLGGIAWVVAGALLSVPTLFFAVVHAAYVPHSLPEFLDLPLAWILTFAGIFGPLMTVAALAVSVAATLQKTVSWQAKVILWSVAIVSCIAWMFIVDVPA